jgi:hypothetical protein
MEAPAPGASEAAGGEVTPPGGSSETGPSSGTRTPAASLAVPPAALLGVPAAVASVAAGAPAAGSAAGSLPAVRRPGAAETTGTTRAAGTAASTRSGSASGSCSGTAHRSAPSPASAYGTAGTPRPLPWRSGRTEPGPGPAEPGSDSGIRNPPRARPALVGAGEAARRLRQAQARPSWGVRRPRTSRWSPTGGRSGRSACRRFPPLPRPLRTVPAVTSCSRAVVVEWYSNVISSGPRPSRSAAQYPSPHRARPPPSQGVSQSVHSLRHGP